MEELRATMVLFYNHLIPSEGAVAVRIIDDGVKTAKKVVVQHVTADGKFSKEKRVQQPSLSSSKMPN